MKQAVQIIRDYGGAFVADVVGLGKSYIGAAIVKHFERTEHARPLIICPATLIEMWERYNEVYQLNARVFPWVFCKGDDAEHVDFLLEDVKYSDRDFVLIDESHNFRHPDTQRYKVLQAFLSTGRKCCLLTATPRNKSAWDVYYQIKLFHQDDMTTLPIDPPDLKALLQTDRDGKTGPCPTCWSTSSSDARATTSCAGMASTRTRTNRSIKPAFNEYLDGTRRAYVMVGWAASILSPSASWTPLNTASKRRTRASIKQLRGYFGRYHRHQDPISLRPTS